MRSKKSLGQNFLRNPHIVRDMVRAGEAAPGDVVVEIGPGKGILTRALLDAGAKVIAIEKDDSLIPVLQKKFAEELQGEKLEIIHGDTLQYPLPSLEGRAGVGWENYKLISNIPYYITGEIFRHFLSLPHKPSLIALMVQKEVARRAAAKDGKESILSLSIKYYGEPRYEKTVAAKNFSPAPKVDSAILTVKNIRQVSREERKDEEKFFAAIKAGFSQKRKKLFGNLLKGEKEKEPLAQAFAACGIPEDARAEDVDFSGWKCLSSMV